MQSEVKSFVNTGVFLKYINYNINFSSHISYVFKQMLLQTFVKEL